MLTERAIDYHDGEKMSRDIYRFLWLSDANNPYITVFPMREIFTVRTYFWFAV